MDDEGRQPIAIGHLSDSGELKIWQKVRWYMNIQLFLWSLLFFPLVCCFALLIPFWKYRGMQPPYPFQFGSANKRRESGALHPKLEKNDVRVAPTLSPWSGDLGEYVMYILQHHFPWSSSFKNSIIHNNYCFNFGSKLKVSIYVSISMESLTQHKNMGGNACIICLFWQKRGGG